MPDPKEKIAANFSAAAAVYDRYAVMQQHAAHSLLRRVADLRPHLPDGPILELGCGTGALSRGVVTLFADRRLTLVDLAPGMIAANKEAIRPHLSSPSQVEWQVQDAERIVACRRYALIVSCLTLQWFQDLAGTLARLGAALIPGGLLLCSFPGDESFPEWRAVCQEMALPCTINALPNAREVLETVRALGLKAAISEEKISIPYPTVRAFFRSLKKTGTSTSLPRPTTAGSEQSHAGTLTRSQMAHLIATWQGAVRGPVTITYRINTLEVRA